MGLLKIFDGRKYKPVGVTVTIPLEKVYPVGAVYISTVATSPATLFGFGTWEQIKDTFILAAGDTYAAGATGGEATHTLTVDEMPSHSHSGLLASTASGGANSGLMAYSGETYRQKMSSVGGGQPHNNMPPYLAVYMWKRTA